MRLGRVLVAYLILASALGPRTSAAETPPLAPAAPATVTITDDGMRWWEHDPGKKRQGNRNFRIGGLAADYTLALHQEQAKQADDTWKTTLACVGMPTPSYGNWYHGGFFGITANGKHIWDRDPVVEVVETGAQGVLDFTWASPLVRARVRFLARPGADHLLMEVRWEPLPDLKALTIGLVCYPEGYGVTEPARLRGATLQRLMTTADRQVPQVNKVDLNLATEWWQFYEDLTLEQEPIYARGGCALAFAPEDMERVNVDVSGYQVSVEATPPVAGGRARFALWDFGGTPNAEAKRRLAAEIATVREVLSGDPLLPTALTGFNPAAEGRRLDNLAKALGASAGGALSGLRRQVTALATQRGLFLDQRSLSAEDALRQALADYRLAYWQAERPTRSTPRVLVLGGPVAYAWGVDRAVRARWGVAAVTRGAYIWKYWLGHSLSYFPGNLPELLGYDVVVLADLPQDPLTEDKRQLLAEFVKRGGGLLVLGGYWSYGAGSWSGSPLEPLLPVAVGGPFDLAPVEGETRVTLTAAGLKRLGKPAGPLGVATWRHNLVARGGTQVWLSAGKQPLAVAGTAGAGRVVAVLAAPLGESPPGQVACWESPGWPALVQRLVTYLACGK